MILWGDKIASINCRTIAIFHQDKLKNRMICARMSWRIRWKSAYSSTRSGQKIAVAQQGFEAILSPLNQRRPFPSLRHKSFLHDPWDCVETSCLAGSRAELTPHWGRSPCVRGGGGPRCVALSTPQQAAGHRWCGWRQPGQRTQDWHKIITHCSKWNVPGKQRYLLHKLVHSTTRKSENHELIR